MLRVVSIVILLALSIVNLKAQPENLNLEKNREETTSDIIYKHDGTKIFVDIKRICLNDIYYINRGENKTSKIDKRLVRKVIHKTGSVEIFNEKAQHIRKVGDFRKIKVTKNPKDVKDLVEVGKIEAKAEGRNRGNSTVKSLERTATIILKRKAALVNANIILITKKNNQVAFGEAPTVTLYGTAYSYK
ncbi:MAG: hypothetical protein MI739_07795 [Bacteroidales bacterium]|nr:hypothetical protein [Bacteroidales bacterium]